MILAASTMNQRLHTISTMNEQMRAKIMAREPWILSFAKAVAKWRPELHNMQLLINEINSTYDITYFGTIPKNVVDIICGYIPHLHKQDGIVDRIRKDYQYFSEKYRKDDHTDAVGIKCGHAGSPILNCSAFGDCTSNIKIKMMKDNDIEIWENDILFSQNTGGLLSKKLYPLPCGLMVLQINLTELCQYFVSTNHMSPRYINGKILVRNAIRNPPPEMRDSDWVMTTGVNVDSIRDLSVNVGVPLRFCEKLNKCVATFMFDPKTNYKVQIDLHDVLGKEIIDDFGNRTPCDDLTDCEYAFSQYSGTCCVYDVCNCV